MSKNGKQTKKKDCQISDEVKDDRKLHAQFRIAEFISLLNMSAKQFPLTLKMVDEVDHILHPDYNLIIIQMIASVNLYPS